MTLIRQLLNELTLILMVGVYVFTTGYIFCDILKDTIKEFRR